MQVAKKLKMDNPFDTLGLFTFLRTYSRRHNQSNPDSTIESWEETINRVITGCDTQLKMNLTSVEKQQLFDILFNLKCSVSGRMLWQLNTKTVDTLGLPSLQNCAFTIVDEPVTPFVWTMNMLMLGCVPANTPVCTEAGVKPIKDIKIGDRVWSFNVKENKKELNLVSSLHFPVIPKDMNIKLKAKYGSLTTSKTHPVLVFRNGSWGYVEAGKVVKGDVIQKYEDGNAYTQDRVEEIEENLDIDENWRDITVENNNNYYTGEGSYYCSHNCGIGFRILPEDVEKLPVVKYAVNTRRDTNDADFIVPDSREGWIQLLGKVLKSHFYSGKSFTYSCLLLRSKGAPIKGFGGLASGPDILCDGMIKIDKILNARTGQKIRPIDALDLMNIIGMVVVSGNVRRSALIAQGSCKDREYLNAKRWDLGNLPIWRCYSNNSIVCNDINEILDDDEFWAGYQGGGEPYGLINLKLTRSCGRLGETQYPDPDAAGYNPCFSGDTLIAVADGRGAVSIKQLAEEGKDVPVYTKNRESGEVEIQWGRHPRKTGEKQKLVRIHFSHPHKDQHLDVTPNHRFFTTDDREMQAKELQKGDSLPIFRKYLKDGYLTNCVTPKKNIAEHRMIMKFFEKEKIEQKIQSGKYSGCCLTEGFVIHHKDENKSNNLLGNLEIMSVGDHCSHHSSELVGDKNPMYGKKHSEETKGLIGAKTVERFQDPVFVEKHRKGLEPYKEKYSESMKKMRAELEKKRASEHEEEAHSVGLKTRREGDVVFIVKNCENCGKEFELSWIRRETCYCSVDCSNVSKTVVAKRTKTNRELAAEKSKENFFKLAMLYKDMEEARPNKPIFGDDFYAAAKEAGLPCRFQARGTNPWIPKNWGDFKRMVDEFNHRVDRIEYLSGEHDVYNITVEQTHIVSVITKYNPDTKEASGVQTFQCGEQPLFNRETCCLAELYLPNIKTQKELMTCATYMYRICKHSLTLPCNTSQETERIVHSNMRMGIGVTGYLMATDEQRSWLKDCYAFLRQFDKEYSIKHGFPTSIKLTTCKPSGTLSILGNVSSGVHPCFARYYKRRVRIASESPLIKVAKEHGYPVEYVENFDGSKDHTTQIITFPKRVPDNAVIAEECTAIQQLEWVKKLQTEWSDNSVSVTVYYKKDELPGIKEWLRKNYNNSVKTVSFLLHSDHGFKQAPYEKISKEEYEELMNQCKPITSLENICYTNESEELIAQGECAGGACPLR